MNEHYTKLSPIDMEILSEAEKKLASSTGKTVALVAFDRGIREILSFRVCDALRVCGK